MNRNKDLNVTLFVNLLLMFFLFSSCQRSEPQLTKKVKSSLVYIRGEDSNKQDLLSSATGFIIAKSDSFFGNKYFVLTTKHSVKGIGKHNMFKAVPFILNKEYNPDPKEFMGNNPILKADNENQFNVEHVIDIDQIDSSIISFTTDKDLPVPYVSNIQPRNLDKLFMYGFTRCNIQNTQNKFYYYHENYGIIATDKYIKKQEGERILKQIKQGEKNSDIDQKGIDLRYSNPSQEGMSGSPLIIRSKYQSQKSNSNDIQYMEYIVGIQNSKFSTLSNNLQEPKTCVLPPQQKYSYGISMKKIISAKNFPEYIKKSMKIFDNF